MNNAVCKRYKYYRSLSPTKRVNSPGLPPSSFGKRRTINSVYKSSVSLVSLGAISKFCLTPYSKIREEMQEESSARFNVNDEPIPQAVIPQMEQFEKPQMEKKIVRIDKIENEQVSVEIFMSEQNENQIIFKGVSQRKKVENQDDPKKIILDQLAKVFSSMKKQYIKMESLEQKMQENKSQMTNNLTNILNSTQHSLRKGTASTRQTRPRIDSQREQNKPKWNYSTRNINKSEAQLKATKSPFLKKQQKYSQTPYQSINQVSSLNSINISTISGKVKPFLLSPDKSESIFEEKFYYL